MYIKSVNLEGIKGFKSLNFDFERPDRKFAGWTVFVGGNASGKSTLLRGLALAMIGPESGVGNWPRPPVIVARLDAQE